MTTYSWGFSGGVGGAAASNLISFQLTLADGLNPDLTAAPAFVYYGARSGLAEIAPPVLYHRGFGVYVAEVPPSDAAMGVVWMIETGSSPPRLAGAVSTSADPLVGFLLEDSTGALWTGADPHFISYANADGTPRPSLPTVLRGARVGVYAFTGSSADATTGTIFSLTSPGGLPVFTQGDLTGTQPITFTAAQQTLYRVRLTPVRDVMLSARVTDASHYTVTPADALVVTPPVVSVEYVSSTAIDLVLSVELATGSYTVSVDGNTWYSPDSLASNDTLPATLAATGDAPVVVAAYTPTLSTVRVLFSKRMRHANAALVSDALHAANYSVTGRTVTGVVAFTDYLVELTLGTPMVALTTYTLTAAGARDLAGTPHTPFSNALPYGTNPEFVATPADVIGDRVLVPAEWRLRRAFQYPTLEFFRQRMLEAVSLSSFAGSRGRCLLFFTQDTDVRAIFTDLFGVTFQTPTARLVQKRPALDVYNDVSHVLDYLAEAALGELRQAQVPLAYTDMLQVRLRSHNFHDKVSAYASVVLLAAAVLA